VNKKNNKYISLDIFLVEILQNISKAKFTVIFISIFFLLSGIFYSKSLPKKFTSYVLVQDLKLIKFNINPEILNKTVKNLSIDYYDNFLHQATSSKTLSDFLFENDKKYLNFKDKTDYESWAKNKISLSLEKKYKGQPFEASNINAELIFTYSDQLKTLGPSVLNDFIIYTEKLEKKKYLYSLILNIEKKIELNKALKSGYVETQQYILKSKIKKLELEQSEFFSSKMREINNEIFRYEQALIVANNLDLKRPLMKNKNQENLDRNIQEHHQLYLEGSIVLATQIENLNLKLKNLEKDELYNTITSEIEKHTNLLKNPTLSDEYSQLFEEGVFLKKNLDLLNTSEINNTISWNPLLERAIKSEREDSNHIFVYAGLIFGIFMSLLFIILKILIQKNTKSYLA
jgi:LPS O-antigen subunit length determinant protein (WzzB/FepE family)